MTRPGFAAPLALAVLVLVPSVALPQRGGAPPAPASIDVEPAELTLEVGETATLSAVARDSDGEALRLQILFLPSDSRNLVVGALDGTVEGREPGEYTVDVRVVGGGRGRGDGFLTAEVPVRVLFPPLARFEIEGLPATLYTGTFLRPDYHLFDARGTTRQDEVRFVSSDEGVLRVDRWGQLRPVAPGTATLSLTAGDLSEDVNLRVEPNPAVSLDLTASLTSARTGDVVHFSAVARDSFGRAVPNLPVYYSAEAQPNPDDPAPPASAEMTQDGRFVAERPGRYTIEANAGAVFETLTLEVSPRHVERSVSLVGRAPVRNVHSSDLWIWESPDGRDLAITGTWGGNGEAYVWDVTDPTDIRRTAIVRVDARTVNDVKVSEDGRLAVITREGASNRVNGLVILDVSNPDNVTTVSEFDDGLTGGVHNAFIDGNYVYAVNNGTRYDVINIGEPANPFRVATFAVDQPGTSIHDVWVDDGIAYSSNWEDGVVLVDVGNGIAGGAPDKPVQFAAYTDPRGQTHAAFPFRSQSTGRSYVVVGDESFPNGLDPQGPVVPAGFMHVVDFTDPDNPVQVARFEIPDAGSHNIWVEDDILYAAFYNAGIRIVDLSGELMGDLFRQGREIAHFLPKDPNGVVPNESMVWGAQPHKGIIYLSDWNSGLWAIRLDPSREDED
jgi:hypothetical protein